VVAVQKNVIFVEPGRVHLECRDCMMEFYTEKDYQSHVNLFHPLLMRYDES
jgi:uncharacterized C2H2 Zn-finger protein